MAESSARARAELARQRNDVSRQRNDVARQRNDVARQRNDVARQQEDDTWQREDDTWQREDIASQRKDATTQEEDCDVVARQRDVARQRGDVVREREDHDVVTSRRDREEGIVTVVTPHVSAKSTLEIENALQVEDEPEMFCDSVQAPTSGNEISNKLTTTLENMLQQMNFVTKVGFKIHRLNIYSYFFFICKIIIS